MTTHLSGPDIDARIAQITDQIRALDKRHQGRLFPEAAKVEWNGLNELERLRAAQLERQAQQRRLDALARDARHTESEEMFRTRHTGGHRDDPFSQGEALRAVDRLHESGEISEGATLRLDHVLRADTTPASAQYIAAASDEHYRTAFGKLLRYGQHAHNTMTDKERIAVDRMYDGMRAASLTTTAGGFAVPVTLDSTVIQTSTGAINPLRQIARVETITGNTWEGVTSAGLTAAFSAEATEASDNSPTLAQPTCYVEKAQAFVPYSIEIGEDWLAFQVELAKLFQSAKDALEATAFISGLGHSSHVPEGLLVGATAIVTSAATATIGVGDVYSLKEALPPRFRPNAKFLAADVTLDKVRRLTGPGNTTEQPVFDDGTGAGPMILRRPAIEHSGMPTTLSSGASAITYGDFSQLLIADRLGMTVEIISHLFGTANNFPSGQRGAFCYWRVGSKVLTPAAFKTLKLL